ncbi:hypothetical protein GJAV_G00249570 [Gymnothorax javanicus]|nr:hypothetical protein GJAV_G00249570 [Gymnothorax javanicus]
MDSGAQTNGNMTDAIITFQVQLSAVMETVLKSAMYEITRLVEDSFLEEVARSKQEVDALRQRLQWSESQHHEREGWGGTRCVDCGRVRASSMETEDRPSEIQSGSDEDCSPKQEKVLVERWGSCAGDVRSIPGPPSVLEVEATAIAITEQETSSAVATVVDADKPDCLLKQEGEGPEEITGADEVQTKWLPSAEGGHLLGAEGAPPLPLSKGCSELQWSPSIRQDTAPSSGSLLPEQQSSRQGGGESCGSYESDVGQEGLCVTGAQHCDSNLPCLSWTAFKLGDSDSEAEGQRRRDRVRVKTANLSGENSHSAKILPARDGPSCARPLNAQPVNAMTGTAGIKQEREDQTGWSEHLGQRVEPQAALLTVRNSVSHPERFSKALTSQPNLQVCGQSGKPTQIRVSDRATAVIHSPTAPVRAACSSNSRALAASKSAQMPQRAFTGDQRSGAAHFEKSITQLVGVRSHLRPHTDRTVHSCPQSTEEVEDSENLAAENKNRHATLNRNLQSCEDPETGSREPEVKSRGSEAGSRDPGALVESVLKH